MSTVTVPATGNKPVVEGLAARGSSGDAPAHRTAYAVAAGSRFNLLAKRIVSLGMEMLAAIEEIEETRALQEVTRDLKVFHGCAPQQYPLRTLVDLASDIKGMKWSLEIFTGLIDAESLLCEDELDEIRAETAAPLTARGRKSR